MLVNTSFNVRGEPIVCSPEDAFKCFMGTELDLLVIGNCILRKEQQKVQAAQVTTQKLKTAHPDYLEIVGDPKFQEWVKESPIRTQLYVSAHNYDLNSANELLGNWKERSLLSNTAVAEAAKQGKRTEAMKNGKGVSRTSSESIAGKKVYRRADLIRLRTNEPDRYEALQDEILSAYSEGRVK